LVHPLQLGGTILEEEVQELLEQGPIALQPFQHVTLIEGLLRMG
jgi:hypothetical protein